MQPNLAPLFEPFTRLTQANIATWTQFWMSPDQPWAPSRVDLFGARPQQVNPAEATQALTRLWSSLLENQTRFMTDLGQRSWASLSAAGDQASQATREAVSAASGTSSA